MQQMSLPLQADQAPVSRDTVVVEGVPVPLRFVRHPKARRYVLRLSPGSRGGRHGAEAREPARCPALRRRAPGLARARARSSARRARADAPSRDRRHRPRRRRAAHRPSRRGHGAALRIGSATVPLASDGVHEAVRRWLRAAARAVLPARLRQFAVAPRPRRDGRQHPQPAHALGIVLEQRANQPQLAPRTDARRGPRLRAAARAHALARPQPLAALLARSGARLPGARGRRAGGCGSRGGSCCDEGSRFKGLHRVQHALHPRRSRPRAGYSPSQASPRPGSLRSPRSIRRPSSRSSRRRRRHGTTVTWTRSLRRTRRRARS